MGFSDEDMILIKKTCMIQKGTSCTVPKESFLKNGEAKTTERRLEDRELNQAESKPNTAQYCAASCLSETNP